MHHNTSDELFCLRGVTPHRQVETHLARASTERCSDEIHQEVIGTRTSYIVTYTNMEA